jgi:hypothetical protein
MNYVGKYFEHHKTVSGSFLSFMASIDMLMTLIISTHFAKPEYNEDLTAFLNDCVRNFNHKHKTLKIIIRDHYPDFDKKHPQLMKDIQDIQGWRNIFAHSQLHPPENNSHEEIKELKYVVWYKYGKQKSAEIKSYKLSSHVEDLQTIQNATNLLNELREFQNQRLHPQ